MAAQKGREILIKMGDGASPAEVFTTIAGIRSRTLTLNRESVDVTNSDSPGMMRELLADGGVRSVSVSGNGVFKSSATEAAVVTHILTGTTHKTFQVIVPGLGTFSGPFHISSSELGGEYNAEVTHAISLDSAGTITFTAGA